MNTDTLCIDICVDTYHYMSILHWYVLLCINIYTAKKARIHECIGMQWHILYIRIHANTFMNSNFLGGIYVDT